MEWVRFALPVLVLWNAIVFCLFGIDKAKAKRGTRRIRESTLLTAAALMGGPGAMLGMFLFRHKTKHAKFTVGVPVLMVANIVVAIVLLRTMG